jgi:hypothetical protein
VRSRSRERGREKGVVEKKGREEVKRVGLRC